MEGPGARLSPRADDVHNLPSLLWPRQSHRGVKLGPHVHADLDIAPVVQVLSGHESRRERFVIDVLTDVCIDTEVITYRAEVITNLLVEPRLRQSLAELLPAMSELVRERQRPVFGREWTVQDIVQRFGQLELYVDVAVRLMNALEQSPLRARALHDLRESMQTLVGTAEFQALQDELPGLRAHLDDVQSITIGVNLSRDLRPESATILSIDPQKIEGRNGLLLRLLGREATGQGITKLRDGRGISFRSFFPPMEADGTGHNNHLVEDLQRLLERVVAPVGDAVERYVWVHSRDFAALDSELSLMLNAVALIERLRAAGLPVCCPEPAPTDDRTCDIDEGYNVSLALRMMQAAKSGDGTTNDEIVTNPITFDEQRGRVWILTGPNRGGKTTYARAVGLTHLLFQAGLYVPARSARMSPVDAIYTHFPGTETTTPGEGRLDDEAVRLAEIFREATRHSLILLNEVLSGTSTLEALALAYDAVRGLRLLGARAIYVTHLHELAARGDEINATTVGDGTVASLVAEIDDEGEPEQTAHRRTFRIRARPPRGVSYASEIAEQHGISYPQLVRLLRERGLTGGAKSY